MRLHATLFASLTLVPALAAQGPPVTRLTTPEAVLREEYTRISGVRELKDGRVIVADEREMLVHVADFKSGAVLKLGRVGSGPGEFRMPVSVYPLNGDSTAIFDDPNQRFLYVLPNGTLGGVARPTRPRGDQPDRGGEFRFMDSRGRLYFTAPSDRQQNGRWVAADSLPIMRRPMSGASVDTLGRIANANEVTESMRGRAHMISVGPPSPFTAQDQFAVASDGSIAVVSSKDYSIVWIDPQGRRRSTPAIPFGRLEVSEEHKREWRESQRGGMAVACDGDKGTCSTVPQRDPNPRDPQPKWPEFMPPFLPGALRFAPDGMLWVKRTTIAYTVPVYDVIDPSGKVSRRVELEKGSRVIGFGADGAIYVVHKDENDLEFLQRFRLR